MTPEEILAQLDEPRTSYQWEAMDAAVEQRDAITPLLLQRLESAAADPAPWIEHEGAGVLYTLALLAHFREERAHQPMARLARWPEGLVDALLGDAITETLPAWLWQTSGGRTDTLEELLADRQAAGFCRGAAAQAMVTGALRGELERDAVTDRLIAYLREPNFAEQGDAAWESVVSAVLDLYPKRYETFLRELATSGAVSEAWSIAWDIEYVLGDTEDNVLVSRRERLAESFPSDVHGYLSHWYGFQPEFWDHEAPTHDPFDERIDATLGRRPVGTGTKPKQPNPDKKKRKRKQQKQSRKKNRKRK